LFKQSFTVGEVQYTVSHVTLFAISGLTPDML